VLRWLPMPIDHILSLLISERDKLARAIDVLQGTPRRGDRPRKTAIAAIDAAQTVNHTPKRRRWTLAMKRAASRRAKAAYAERMKKAARKG
jgi:hypothetical protein